VAGRLNGYEKSTIPFGRYYKISPSCSSRESQTRRGERKL